MKLYHLILALPLLLMVACGPPPEEEVGQLRQGIAYCSYDWIYTGTRHPVTPAGSNPAVTSAFTTIYPPGLGPDGSVNFQGYNVQGPFLLGYNVETQITVAITRFDYNSTAPSPVKPKLTISFRDQRNTDTITAWTISEKLDPGIYRYNMKMPPGPYIAGKAMFDLRLEYNDYTDPASYAQVWFYIDSITSYQKCDGGI